MNTHECTGVWQCVYAYQTLITGLLAILAGTVAALVAYGQLRRMTTQSNVMISTQLSQQIARIERSRRWVLGRFNKFNEDVSRRFYEFATFENDVINVHWAFEYSSEGSRLGASMEKHRDVVRLPQSIDAALGEALNRLGKFSDTLDNIHRPASMVQHDEDHSFSDAEWNKVHDGAALSESRAGSEAEDLRVSIAALEASYNATLKQARDRLSIVDNAIIGSKSG